MKLTYTILAILFTCTGFAQTAIIENNNPNYDSSLAKTLGADDFGMKTYIFVLLKTGPNQAENKELMNKSFRAHLENINKLVEEGELIVAGPFGKNEKGYRGIFILDNVSTIAEAEKLLENDPAIGAGFLKAEFIEWYGSAALPEYLKTADRIWKLNP